MTIKYAPVRGAALATRVKTWIGDAAYTNMCQAWVVTMAGTGAVGDFDGDRAADAEDGWRKAVKYGRVVHAKDIKSYSDIPAGVPLYWTGGSKDYGHTCISIGNGQMVSTDAGARWGIIGQRDIGYISRVWQHNLVFAGYVLEEGNGYTFIAPPVIPAITKESVEYTVTTTTLNGRSGPGTSFPIKATAAKGAKITSVGYVKVGTTTWVKNTAGLWWSKTYLAARTVTPPPPAPVVKAVSLNIGTLNVIRWRLAMSNPTGKADVKKGANYEDRVAGLAKIREAMGVSILMTQESGRYEDANLLSKTMGSTWKNVLHGDNGDLTNAIHWDSSKRTMLAEGKFETSGAHHNWATWVLFKDIKSGVVFLVVTTHLEYRTRGTTSASEWDKIRGTQTRALVAGAQKVAIAEALKLKLASIPIVFGGDFNIDDDDAFDTAGEEMVKAGYSDAEKVALVKSGPETTYSSDLDPTKVAGRRLDRLFTKKGTPIASIRTVVGPPSTDHYGVGISLTLTN